jgi:hypothetical protein
VGAFEYDLAESADDRNFDCQCDGNPMLAKIKNQQPVDFRQDQHKDDLRQQLRRCASLKNRQHCEPPQRLQGQDE